MSVYVVDGGIGTGKSTLISRIVGSARVQRLLLGTDALVVPIYEPLESWQQGGIFQCMCADPGEWATEFQHVALVTRIAAWKAAMQGITGCANVHFLLERAPAADRLVFTEIHRRRGNISAQDAAEHERWHARVWKKRPAEVKRVAMLRCDFDTELARLKRRDRGGEDKYMVEYLREVHAQYELMPKMAGWPHKNTTVEIDAAREFHHCDRALYDAAAIVFGVDPKQDDRATLDCTCEKCH